MERFICNHCEKEIDHCDTPGHIEAKKDINLFCDEKDSFNLCDECYKKVFNIKEE